MWNDTYKRGLLYVEQLFSDGDYKSRELVLHQYGLTTLRSAIPIEWKDFFCSNPRIVFYPLAPHNYDKCIQGIWKNVSNKVYRFLADDVLLIHSKYIKWIQELGSDFCDGICDFGQRHLDLYKVTNVTKYRNFQYQVAAERISDKYSVI